MELETRSACRARLTKLINTINDMLEEEIFDAREGDILIIRVKIAMDNANTAVAPLIEPDRMQQECERIQEYKENGVTAIARLKQRIADCNKRTVTSEEITLQTSIHGKTMNGNESNNR